MLFCRAQEQGNNNNNNNKWEELNQSNIREAKKGDDIRRKSG